MQTHGGQVSLTHPQLKSYSELALRHRFLRGFCPAAYERLRIDLAEEMGRRGLANRPLRSRVPSSWTPTR